MQPVVPGGVPGRIERGEQATPTPPPPLPRCDRPEHRQFDFWVGEWDVRPNGQPESAPTPLKNDIRLEDGGCVVTEHWTMPRMTGRSVNIFDRTRGEWHQTWVDSTGGLHQYWGRADAEGTLVFYGETPVDPNPPAESDVIGIYSGYGDPNLLLCNLPVSDLGASLIDLGTLFDAADPHPLTLVGLIGFRGVGMFESAPADPGEVSFYNEACLEVAGSARVSA